jgi:quinolinate synthase
MIREGLKDADEIIFIPDKYLADYVAAETGRSFIVWPGFCPTHARILPENVLQEKELHPEAVMIAHPECPPELRKLADCVTSTEGMCRYAKETKAKEIIVATERGILHRLRNENPGKVFYPASKFALCMNMKLIQLEKILWALEDMACEIIVPEKIADQARTSIQRMIDFNE